MQRISTVLLTSLVAGFLMTGCPEKKVEKEEPAAPQAVERSKVDEKAADKAAEEDQRGDEPEEKADDSEKKPVRKLVLPKKDQAGEEKDQGGW